jgi:hypothetical protein
MRVDWELRLAGPETGGVGALLRGWIAAAVKIVYWHTRHRLQGLKPSQRGNPRSQHLKRCATQERTAIGKEVCRRFDAAETRL